MKLSTAELVDLMFSWHARYNLETIGYERTAFTEGLQQYLNDEMRRRNRFLSLVEFSHRMTNKHTRIQQALEPRYARRTIYHLTVAGVNQCIDLEEELLSFPKAINDERATAPHISLRSRSRPETYRSVGKWSVPGSGSRRTVRDNRSGAE